MNRIDEMNHNAAMARAERTDTALRSFAPLSKIRPTIDTQELADIVDGLTAQLAYGRLTELEFYRVRDTRDRFANLLSEITPKVTR